MLSVIRKLFSVKNEKYLFFSHGPDHHTKQISRGQNASSRKPFLQFDGSISQQIRTKQESEVQAKENIKKDQQTLKCVGDSFSWLS